MHLKFFKSEKSRPVNCKPSCHVYAHALGAHTTLARDLSRDFSQLGICHTHVLATGTPKASDIKRTHLAWARREEADARRQARFSPFHLRKPARCRLVCCARNARQIARAWMVVTRAPPKQP